MTGEVEAMPKPLGSLMASEIAEQPEVLARIARRADGLSSLVRELIPQPRGVAFLARGSSDHAALLGRYAMELAVGLPTCLLAPSLITGYGADPSRFAGWLLVALSQSGLTPEIVQVARRFSQSRVRTVAITNDADSDLARAVDVVIDVDAGAERAVPATKTVTAQMLAVLAVSNGLVARAAGAIELSAAAEAARQTLSDDRGLDGACEIAAGFGRMAVLGRGLMYPAAKETALKLQETLGVMAHGFSTADFRHGPIATCGPESPAILFAGSGPVDSDTVAVRDDLAARGAPVTLIGGATNGDVTLYSGNGLIECIAATIRGQQLALGACRLLGIDPDTPRGLNKITLTY